MSELPFSPWDLLPIDNPKDNQPNKDYFYNNVIKFFIPDIVEMEANGIPISLNKVDELDRIVSDVLDKVKNNLKNNPLVIEFLKSKHYSLKKERIKNLEQKKKSYEDFIKPYNPKNEIHRTYLINLYLDSISKSNMKIDKWSIKDIKILNQMIGTKFISDLLENKIQEDHPLVIEAMNKLAKDKCEAYNKNKIDTKVQSIHKEKILPEFNPSSPTQLKEFFEFYEIESENFTPTGNPKWDRKELERIQRMLKTEIERKENE